MIKVYICHPYASDPKGNLEKVKVLCQKFAEESIEKMIKVDDRSFCPIVYGLVPNIISPMLLFPEFMSEEGGVSRKHAMAFCIDLLDCCDEIWVCSRNISEGMADEISYASENKIRIVWKV